MNAPETRTNTSPSQMHQKIVAGYGELPPKASITKALGISAATIAGYFLIFLPLTSGLGEGGETINIFGFFFAAFLAFGALMYYLPNLLDTFEWHF